eukprot:scaffold614_cov367-Prasinococcus_capsulatus_cf.AAC.14
MQCQRSLLIPRPTYGHLNQVLARALGSSLAPAKMVRSPVRGPLDRVSNGRQTRMLSDIVQHLLPHPRYRLLSVRHAPELAESSQPFHKFQWDPVMRSITQLFTYGGTVEGRTYQPNHRQREWQSSGMDSSPRRGSHGPHIDFERNRLNKALASYLILRGGGAQQVNNSALMNRYASMNVAVANKQAAKAFHS